VEIGISTFVETTPDPHSGKVVSHAERIRQVVEEIILADKVGLDVFGVGEHHRKDYAASAPAMILAAASTQTSRIRLTSAVSVFLLMILFESSKTLRHWTDYQMDVLKLWLAAAPLSNHSRFLAMI